MRTEIREVNGIWVPATEEHMVPFLQDRAQMVNGRGTYQRKKWQTAIALCPPTRRRLAVDVGSHVGLWSAHLAAAFEAVECFEPHPLHRHCWELNMRAAQARATLHGVALGARADRLLLASNPASSGDTWIDPASSGDPLSGDGRERFEVEVATLDMYDLSHVDLLKLDCEGFELPVLRGARRTLEEWRPLVVVEQKLPKPGHAFTARYGYGPTDACTYLEQLGAKLQRVISGDYFYAWP